MDNARFDSLNRSLSGATTRRGALAVLAGLGGLAGLNLSEVAGKRRRRGDKMRGERHEDRGGAGVRKVAICHRTRPGTFHRITIAERAMSAHLNHGDFLPASVNGCCTDAECDDGSSNPPLCLEGVCGVPYDGGPGGCTGDGCDDGASGDDNTGGGGAPCTGGGGGPVGGGGPGDGMGGGDTGTGTGCGGAGGSAGAGGDSGAG